MSSNTKLKEAYDIESKHGAFYTGGNIQWLEDTLYCQTHNAVNLLNIETGTVTQSIGEPKENEEIDAIQTFTTDGNRFVSSHKSGLLKLWNQSGTLEKMWKYIHKGPIAKLCLKLNILASGGSDSTVRIWDMQYQTCFLALKGCQGVINVVEFHSEENSLFASGDDGKINQYELKKGELINVYEAHFSKVTAIVFTHDKNHFVSCGRDKVLVLWEFNKKTPLKTTAIYEAIETIVGLPAKFKLPDFKSSSEEIYVASAGENGVVRVWALKNPRQVYAQSNSLVSKATEGGLAVTHLIYNQKFKSLAIVTVEHNIVIHHLKSFVCLKQFIGFSDDILDIAFLGKHDSHFAVATNSKDIKLYTNNSMSCQLLKGHEDFVLALAVCPQDRDLLLSASKDNSVRLWKLIAGVQMDCLATAKKHTGSVGSVSFFQNFATNFISASHDTCLKLWTIQENKQRSTVKVTLNCKQTVVAHQKDINSVSVSPNDKMVASASQDKTVKLWTSDSLELIGMLKGHKRGVWSVRFSPVDQVVVTSSADCTIKLWSVANLSCLKTFEGHESSVLKAEFLSHGLQILSAGADGLLKLFNIKNSECQCTMDQHEGRVWALAVKPDESGFISGGSDSYLIKWKDVTEERKQQRQKELEELALEEQKLSNYIQSDKLLKALKLALKLERPFQTLKIVERIIKRGESGLPDTIESLRNDQKESLLNCALNWNMNSKNCHPAQLVINILMGQLQTGDFRPVGFSNIMETALPYTERHFKRLTQMMQDINLVSYSINCMQPHSKSVQM
ncbi:hypothetical protein ABEB36_009806 [Hypothenemus hampei]|uniref:U3 small nucleolar RNA-associated protein 13 C-terminal domain-containing protein n=1 Tax=Hypothenemus hampei TaxID=57062 RepID=A0ABD1ELL3_HYPHA